VRGTSGRHGTGATAAPDLLGAPETEQLRLYSTATLSVTGGFPKLLGMMGEEKTSPLLLEISISAV